MTELFGTGNQTGNYARKYKSIPFNFSNLTTIATGTFYLFDYWQDNNKSQKYGSFNNLFVSNNSDQDIVIYPNQDQEAGGVPVPNRSEKGFDSNIIPMTSSLLIENIGSGTIGIGELRIVVWNDQTEINRLVSRAHESLISPEISPKVADRFYEMINRLRSI